MRYFLIIQFIISFIFGTRVFDSHSQHTLDNNRSCGQRPVLNHTIVSPSGHFVIHFDDYYIGIEDYAYNVSIAADSSRKVIVDIMNFRSEIADNDGLYDIYITQLPNGSYGWNCPEEDLGASWVEIDDNYIGSNYSTTGEDAMKISIAHEFFHAIQRAYVPTPGSNSFFYELSSMWIEDIIYPEINDYIFFSQFGDDYFEDPEKNMNSYNGYGLGLYGHYMNFIFDNQIMQRIWEEFASIDSENEDEYVYDAINYVLSNQDYGYNSSFADTWLDFNSRNLFNGYFNNMENEIYYYLDQSQFNPINSLPRIIDSLETINFNVNNESVSIESFIPYDLSFINIYNSHNYMDVKGSVALFSNFSLIDSINHNYQSNIISTEDIFHILYISDLEDRDFDVVISSTVLELENSDNIFIYPNPVSKGDEVTFRIDQGLQLNNLDVNLYNITGGLLKTFNLGPIYYTIEDFNELKLFLFDENNSSGIYILSFDLDGKIINKKITYLK